MPIVSNIADSKCEIMEVRDMSDEQLRVEYRATLENYNVFIKLQTTQADKDRFMEYKDDYLGEILAELKRRSK
ncbi:MAG TPA: hypothetical protein VM101_08240 [Flavitalea sp.]|nr:hypothetical protein [Flavitalea sp.]